MKFYKELLQEMVYEDRMDLEDGEYGFEGPAVIKNVQKEIVDTSRWSVIYDQILSVTQGDVTKFYRAGWSEGATENQDERPYEYEDDEIELSEVFPVVKSIVVYE